MLNHPGLILDQMNARHDELVAEASAPQTAQVGTPVAQGDAHGGQGAREGDPGRRRPRHHRAGCAGRHGSDWPVPLRRAVDTRRGQPGDGRARSRAAPAGAARVGARRLARSRSSPASPASARPGWSHELLAAVPDGTLVFVGHAEPGSLARPYELLLDALAGHDARRRTAALEELTDAARSPVERLHAGLRLIDDAHRRQAGASSSSRTCTGPTRRAPRCSSASPTCPASGC